MSHRALLLLLSALVSPLAAYADLQWVTFNANPIEGINSLFEVSIGLDKNDPEVIARFFRLEESAPRVEVWQVRVKNRTWGDPQPTAPCSTGKPVDKLESPDQIDFCLLLFLPLGRYRVEVSNGSSAKASNEVDTREFLKILAQEAPHASRSWGGERRGQGKLELGEASITPEAPKSRIAGKPRFRWKLVGEPWNEAVLYVFDTSGLVWQTPMPKQNLPYDVPRLQKRHTYFWVLGARGNAGLYRFAGLPSFEKKD